MYGTIQSSKTHGIQLRIYGTVQIIKLLVCQVDGHVLKSCLFKETLWFTLLI